MEIIKVNPSDADTLLAISWRTFYESFNHLNTPENMHAYMSKAFTRDKLFSELLNPFSEFYFGTENETVVGYLKINTFGAQSDIHDEQSLEVERIYVDSKYQGLKYGERLLEKAKERGRELDLYYIWLGVWEKNGAGIRFYRRHGFEIFSSHPFVFGDEVQTDLLMKYFLKKPS